MPEELWGREINWVFCGAAVEGKPTLRSFEKGKQTSLLHKKDLLLPKIKESACKDETNTVAQCLQGLEERIRKRNDSQLGNLYFQLNLDPTYVFKRDSKLVICAHAVLMNDMSLIQPLPLHDVSSGGGPWPRWSPWPNSHEARILSTAVSDCNELSTVSAPVAEWVLYSRCCLNQARSKLMLAHDALKLFCRSKGANGMEGPHAFWAPVRVKHLTAICSFESFSFGLLSPIDASESFP